MLEAYYKLQPKPKTVLKLKDADLDCFNAEI